jgi:hypothetical protein
MLCILDPVYAQIIAELAAMEPEAKAGGLFSFGGMDRG